ncbi:hypothetical protein [Sulfurimonas sp.]|uniref:hypothetical protein n=1 Tax=Sulfurimonas sp. TaxID=2022749 RepID=UPI003567F362
MKIQTQYNYEKTWTTTNEADLLRIIEEEIGDADPKGTLEYVKEAIKGGKIITVGSCRFKKEEPQNVSK